MILGRKEIVQAVNEGRIQVDPFRIENVSVNSIDVCLGPELYRLQGAGLLRRSEIGLGRGLSPVVVPYMDSGPQYEKVEPVDGLMDRVRDGAPEDVLEGYNDVPGFVLEKGIYLASTLEMIGTSEDSGLIPDMDSKSTMARWGLTTSLGAGRGDVGFAARWTMVVKVEIPTVLFVGTKIAQVRFTEAKGVDKAYTQGETGYQTSREDGTYPLKQLPKRLSLG